MTSHDIPLIRFRYLANARGRCYATYGNFNATVDNNGGTNREPYRAELRHGAKVLAGRNFRSLTLAQSWLRDLIKATLDTSTTFELADYVSTDDLDGRFKRRAAQKASKLGLRIISVTSSRVTLEEKPTEVRTYHCLRETALEQGRA